jgi:hypothetical protein
MAESTTGIPHELRAKAKQAREALGDCPPVDRLVAPEDFADAAPFYHVLRAFVANLKAERLRQGLDLAAMAERAGLPVELLVRLESGELVNPTWQTLGRYTVAVGRRLTLEVEAPTA